MELDCVYVDCLKEDEIVATYEFVIVMFDVPDVANMVNQAKSNLVTLGITEPMGNGITYKVRY